MEVSGDALMIGQAGECFHAVCLFSLTPLIDTVGMGNISIYTLSTTNTTSVSSNGPFQLVALVGSPKMSKCMHVLLASIFILEMSGEVYSFRVCVVCRTDLNLMFQLQKDNVSLRYSIYDFNNKNSLDCSELSFKRRLTQVLVRHKIVATKQRNVAVYHSHVNPAINRILVVVVSFIVAATVVFGGGA